MNSDTMNYDPNTYDPKEHMIVPGIAKLGDWCMGWLGILYQAKVADVGHTRLLIVPRPLDLHYALDWMYAHPMQEMERETEGHCRFRWNPSPQHPYLARVEILIPGNNWASMTIGPNDYEATDWQPVEQPNRGCLGSCTDRASGQSFGMLSKKYGVNISCVFNVCHRKAWSHVI